MSSVQEGGNNASFTDKGRAAAVIHRPEPAIPGPAVSQEGRISLKILESGETLPLELSHGITIGRAEAGQLIVPDVDLSPYQAYKAGVSRLHAALNLQDQQLVIVELGSANGTRVNGKILPTHASHPLFHGDILTLGKLNVQILFDSGDA
jgi:pSer/pThr/pTyr-binding forkhead associated (FHA) protein